MNIYTLEVFLIGGPITEEFAKKNRIVLRTIAIRGDQTLEDLHNAIFEALEREDQHMYEFQFGGKGPNDPQARRYGLASLAAAEEEGEIGDVRKTTIDSLGLKKDEAFGYWFDFGDDWWHQVNVTSIRNQKTPEGTYPRLTKKLGKSPPQYAEFDEEDG
jgi:hypothetical protein